LKQGNNEKLNINMEQINISTSGNKNEAKTSKNLLFNKARNINSNNTSNIMSYQDLKGN